ncbi:hypothetical protein QTG56_25360 (plasmid) [Rossellomorea sp. AcN35-11]|nr:hypothetical protein [Rossellomorea aquimaris]WJV31945.1 hypothetical protein QTG56_25360 [Rossellomorea sp. AcN35-11]
MKTQKELIKKAVEFAIDRICDDINELDECLETRDYGKIQRVTLERKMVRLKSDLEDFKAVELN